MKLIIIGMKACGKTTIGKLLSKNLKISFLDLDTEVEKLHFQQTNKNLTVKKIFEQKGEYFFRNLEEQTLAMLNCKLECSEFVLSCGGGTPVSLTNRQILKNMGIIIYLETDTETIKKRVKDKNWPAKIESLSFTRKPIYEELANIKIKVTQETPANIVKQILKQL